jgi:hypothetical protein
MGSSMIFATSLGMTIGSTNVSGVTGRTWDCTALGAATTGTSIGGGGGGGGGPIGDTSVINNSRSGIVWGINNGMMSTVKISTP